MLVDDNILLSIRSSVQCEVCPRQTFIFLALIFIARSFINATRYGLVIVKMITTGDDNDARYHLA